jgi:hypothetical protein
VIRAVKAVNHRIKEIVTGKLLFECKKYFSLAVESTGLFILTIKGYRT